MSEGTMKEEDTKKKADVAAWAYALRLRTLPLSWAGTVMAAGLAASVGVFRWSVFVLMFFTASLLQILSNMANDYGDYVKGTDGESRIGPRRALASGRIAPGEFVRGMLVVCLLTMGVGLALVLTAFGWRAIGYVLLFLALGAGCIVAAVKYTVGRRAYGYSGWGEVFVFLFFGLVAVCGGAFLYTGRWDALWLLPGAALGLLSSGVLHLNNLRDAEGDRANGKNTLASRMSLRGGLAFQCGLIVGAIVLLLVYMEATYRMTLWYLPTALCLINIPLTAQIKRREEADKLLKVLSLSTLAMCAVFAVAVNV